MEEVLASLLHPRILDVSGPLVDDGHYPEAANQAMSQVELAMKEKSGIRDKYGVRLAESVFGPGAGIKLTVPFGDDMQKKAKDLFTAAFGYYRNYTAHAGRNVSRVTCIRVIILASELLDLIGASEKSFFNIGGLPGLVREQVFNDAEEVRRLLRFVDGYQIVDDVADGFYEELATRGFTDEQLKAVYEVGLAEFVVDSENALRWTGNDDPLIDTVTIAHFALTNVGRTVLDGESRDSST